jgi:uncharacterized membrane protein
LNLSLATGIQLRKLFAQMKGLLLIPFLVASLFAQDAPPRHLRLLPLGEVPTLKPNGIDPKTKARLFKEPPPGSFLPSDIGFQAGENILPLQLSLQSITPLFKLPAETTDLLLRPTNGGAPWLSKKAPRLPLLLGVLYRDPATMNWNNPKLLFLKDDATAFPKGTARFVNVSETMVLLRIGKGPKLTTYGIPPGGSTKKPLKMGENHIWIGYKDKGGQITMHTENDIFLQEGERAAYFFYKPQAKKPRKPFLIHHKIEKPPKP